MFMSEASKHIKSISWKMVVFNKRKEASELTWLDRLAQRLFCISESCFINDIRFAWNEAHKGSMFRVGLTMWPLFPTEPARKDNWWVKFAAIVVFKRAVVQICFSNLYRQK